MKRQILDLRVLIFDFKTKMGTDSVISSKLLILLDEVCYGTCYGKAFVTLQMNLGNKQQQNLKQQHTSKTKNEVKYR